MQWIELSALVREEVVEKVVSLLGQYGQGGATIEERQKELDGEKEIFVRAYIPHGHAYKSIRCEIVQSLVALPYPVQLAERLLKPEDWLDSLKKHFGILELGEKFIVKPSWIKQTLPDSTRTVIELDPGAAFGTGLHPTTRLCLQRLEKHLAPGNAVFDLGTGSGILAIAAAKLGAGFILALDIDPVAVKAARSNARINHVEDCIQVKRGTVSSSLQKEYQDRFEIVLANITSKTIADLSRGIARVMKPGGLLVASGIHSQGLDEVLIRLALVDLKLEAIDREDEWHTVVARKI